MKCSFISDIHIQNEGDAGCRVLSSFLTNPKTQDSDKVIFLGDIFEILIGEHKGFIEDYPSFFNGIVDLVNKGKEVVFIEGNHDFHFEKILTNYVSQNTKNSNLFRYLRDGEEIILNGNKYYYCHGYEVDYHNKYFKRWYKIYSSKLFAFYVSHILTHKLIKKLGDWASKDSKRRGKKKFDRELMKDKYLDGAKDLIREKNLKGVIAGHTHICSFTRFEDGTEYYNNGFPRKDQHFIHFNGNSFEKIDL